MALPEYDESIVAEAAKLTPEEAVAFFRAKGFAITWDWAETLNEANLAVFQVAKATNLDVLQDLRDAVDDAVENGTTFANFKKELEPKLAKKGWTGKKFLANPRTGEKEFVELGTPRRLETIYRTNTQSAYNAGRWDGQWRNRGRRPYLKLIEILDGATRPTHRAMSGSIKKVTSTFWNVWYPPNGYNCRGRVQTLTEAQAKAQSFGVRASHLPDEGFSNNPGREPFKPGRQDYDTDLWNEGKKMNPADLDG